MLLKNYIKSETKNIGFNFNGQIIYISQEKEKIYNDNKIPFNRIYELYTEFKALGKDLYKNYGETSYKIIIDENEVKLQWLDENIYDKAQKNLTYLLTSKYSINNEDLGLYNIRKKDILNFAAFVYLCSKSVEKYYKIQNLTKKYATAEYQKTMDFFKKYMKIYENKIEREFELSDLGKIPIIVEKMESKKSNISQIYEKLKYTDNIPNNANIDKIKSELNVIMPYIIFNNLMSILFHFFKLEIVYYSFLIEEKKKPHLCKICHKWVIGKCNCVTFNNSYRSNINKKCKNRKDKLKWYLDEFDNFIFTKYKHEIKQVLNQRGHWQDLPKLEKLINDVENCLKEQNIDYKKRRTK